MFLLQPHSPFQTELIDSFINSHLYPILPNPCSHPCSHLTQKDLDCEFISDFSFEINKKQIKIPKKIITKKTLPKKTTLKKIITPKNTTPKKTQKRIESDEVQWMSMYNKVKNLNSNHLTPSLKCWIYRQKKNYKINKLNPKFIKLLEQIPNWFWN